MFISLLTIFKPISDLLKLIQTISNKIQVFLNTIREYLLSWWKTITNPHFWLQNLASVGFYFSLMLFLPSLAISIVLLGIVLLASLLPFGGILIFGDIGTVLVVALGAAAASTVFSFGFGLFCLLVKVLTAWGQRAASIETKPITSVPMVTHEPLDKKPTHEEQAKQKIRQQIQTLFTPIQQQETTPSENPEQTPDGNINSTLHQTY